MPGEGGLRIGQAEPHGVYQDDMEPAGEEYAALASVLATRPIPWLAGQVLRFRSLMPALMTTEDDPMLLIEATIAVSGDLARRLRAHPSFGLQDPDDEATFTWFGDVVPGGVADSETGEPERWTQGRLTVKEGQVQVSVNSDRRFTRIVGILDKLGVSPVVRSQTRVDPAREFGWATAVVHPGRRCPRARVGEGLAGHAGAGAARPDPGTGRRGRRGRGRAWSPSCASSGMNLPTTSWPASPASTSTGSARN